MSIQPPFYLSSYSGAIHLKVTENQVSEVCLFEDRISCIQYPLKVQELISKTILYCLKETSVDVFEKAHTSFFERLASDFSSPTPKQIEQAATVAEALKVVCNPEEFPF